MQLKKTLYSITEYCSARHADNDIPSTSAYKSIVAYVWLSHSQIVLYLWSVTVIGVLVSCHCSLEFGCKETNLHQAWYQDLNLHLRAVSASWGKEKHDFYFVCLFRLNVLLSVPFYHWPFIYPNSIFIIFNNLLLSIITLKWYLQNKTSIISSPYGTSYFQVLTDHVMN